MKCLKKDQRCYFQELYLQVNSKGFVCFITIRVTIFLDRAMKTKQLFGTVSVKKIQ